jgi:ATP-dependent Clp protease ATP-binding subunit ClpC
MERFTQRARRVLSLAQEEAERMQHSHIGTEHLLLGLMREEGGVAGRV